MTIERSLYPFVLWPRYRTVVIVHDGEKAAGWIAVTRWLWWEFSSAPRWE